MYQKALPMDTYSLVLISTDSALAENLHLEIVAFPSDFTMHDESHEGDGIHERKVHSGWVSSPIPDAGKDSPFSRCHAVLGRCFREVAGALSGHLDSRAVIAKRKKNRTVGGRVAPPQYLDS
jgi:hypothetical protein